MESVLTKACTIRIQNFEGPFDLLFHLIEENKVNIYDIPINIITDQYMEYLFAMQELDMEVASEFLLMASTLLHIKSRMLLPQKKEASPEDEIDPREELVMRLLEYRKYKEFSLPLKEREAEWGKLVYKLPEAIQFTRVDETLELSVDQLKSIYMGLLARNRKKVNPNVSGMATIIQHEKVSLRSKMREITAELISKAFFRFSDFFSLKKRTKTEVVTGFMAVLELAKLKKVRLEQKKQFDDIMVYRTETGTELEFEEHIEVAELH